MNMPNRTAHRLTMPLLALLFTLAQVSCADLQGAGTSQPDTSDLNDPGAPAEQHEAVRKAAGILVEGIRLYEGGDYKEAIAILDAPALQAAPDAIRVEALKYSAFSHCVMKHYAQCRHAFDLSLGIDAGFELSKTERGHPMWGPVFKAAKAANDQEREHTSIDHERERWRGVDLWRAK